MFSGLYEASNRICGYWNLSIQEKVEHLMKELWFGQVSKNHIPAYFRFSMFANWDSFYRGIKKSLLRRLQNRNTNTDCNINSLKMATIKHWCSYTKNVWFNNHYEKPYMSMTTKRKRIQSKPRKKKEKKKVKTRWSRKVKRQQLNQYTFNFDIFAESYNTSKLLWNCGL